MIERTYNVPLRKGFRNKAMYKKTKKAVTTLREFLEQHMKSNKVLIGKNLNEYLWKHGIKNPPHHVKVTVIKEDDGTVKAELLGFKYEHKKKDEKAEKTEKKNKKEDKTKKDDTVEEKKESKEKKSASKDVKDDLTQIEGIGPKIAEILVKSDIKTFDELAKSSPEQIKEILVAAGTRYKMHDPSTWPEQAQLAADGKWDELKELQDRLNSGKK